MVFSSIKNSINNAISSVTAIEKNPPVPIAPIGTLAKLSVLAGEQLIISDSGSGRFNNNQSLQNIIDGKKVLAQGAKGEDVILVQTALQDMGFFIGDKADGKYGNQTVVALKNFQSNRSIPQTGILDKTTLSELDKVAPPVSKKIWDTGIFEQVKLRNNDNTIIPSNQLDRGKTARVVIDLSEHRLFYFNQDNTLNKVYSIASGKDGHADGRGGRTAPGLKKVTYKDNDPTETANRLWPETNGKAFGTKLLDLSWYDINTGKTRASGEEIHGTYTSSSIGTDASHGCMRMLNKDVEELFTQIKPGDLVKVQE